MRFPWKRLRIPILYYHEIGLPSSKHVLAPGAFEAQRSWLADAGFQPLSLDAVADVYEGRREAPDRGMALTFDDGRSGVGRHAAAALSRRGWPATLYVVTGWLDGAEIPDAERYSEFLGWDEVRDLRDRGFTIVSHTVSHANLKRIPVEAAAEEISASRRRLEEALEAPVSHFSFPYGRRTRVAERLVQEAGYRTAKVTGERVNGRFARLHRLARIRVDGREPLEAFRARLLSR